ncbi:hypothetical protein ACFORL_03470 [Legionella dresdenensis]|uniref:Uncharacterized protein n=1 Tax=Legionella dresdenensis TaxID=450200 RepID=A0ABV8CCV2_9GAMM
MLYTLALLVVLASIFVFFSQEFSNMAKKLFSIFWIRLLLPLILASIVVARYELWILVGAVYLKNMIDNAVAVLASLLPYQSGSVATIKILLLLLLTLVPGFALDYYSVRKTYVPYKHTWIVMVLIWLFVLIFLLVPIQNPLVSEFASPQA